MNEHVFWTGIGALAAFCTSFGFVPQILKMWRSQSAKDVSVATFYQFIVGVTCWGLYGVYRSDWVLIIANLVTLLTLLTALALYYRAKILAARQAAAESERKTGGTQNLDLKDTAGENSATFGEVKL